ncbi:hypothetical protein AGMMS49938_15560 [Fibrobacterales bacterium]|nr:hypothetical protein AGMMS49938_15560 [Fibrobacterales bacterium]
MTRKIYTIQIVPEGSNRARTYRINRNWVKVFGWLISLIAILLCVFIWKFAEINLQLAASWKLKTENEYLLKRHAEYEATFTQLDSIYVIETQIQNILQTYLEDDSGKVRSILDKNRFSHISSEQVRQDTDHETEYLRTRQDLENFPNMLPVMGVISRHYTDEHTGVDFAASMNEPVFATASGKVVFAGDKEDLGLVVEIDHGQGVSTRYAHLARFSIRKGDAVRKGSVIAFVGNTGNSNGAHLHYEVISNGKSLNPEKYF